jgi:hypothetical protein
MKACTLLTFILLLLFRDSYGNFLARLETTFGVSQKGVQVIAAEMIHLANRVLAHSMKSVTQHLGKLRRIFLSLYHYTGLRSSIIV